MDKSKLIYIISGPTASGKTDFALRLAKEMSGEIINIDVGQFYKPLSIGTAKPDLMQVQINHHLFDIIDEPKDFTVYEFRKILIAKINEIHNKNKLPILVGGSGFYIQSLFFPPHDLLKPNQKKNEFNNHNWEKLYEIDPKRAQSIEKNDKYRIERALEIWANTGIKPSQYMPAYEPEFEFVLFILTRPRGELYQRINKRTLLMIEHGWINEVQQLDKDWHEFLKKKKLIGYDDIIKYLESEDNADQDILIETIQKKTRNYAKRQITFFKALTKKIINAELSSKSLEIFAKKIVWLDINALKENDWKSFSNY